MDRGRGCCGPTADGGGYADATARAVLPTGGGSGGCPWSPENPEGGDRVAGLGLPPPDGAGPLPSPSARRAWRRCWRQPQLQSARRAPSPLPGGRPTRPAWSTPSWGPDQAGRSWATSTPSPVLTCRSACSSGAPTPLPTGRGRRLHVHDKRDLGVQPDPPLRGRVPDLRRRPDPPHHRGGARRPRRHHRAVLPQTRAGVTRVATRCAGSPATTVQLAVTTRTGIGQFTFPADRHGNLLFKVSGSADGSTASSVQVHRHRRDDRIGHQRLLLRLPRLLHPPLRGRVQPPFRRPRHLAAERTLAPRVVDLLGLVHDGVRGLGDLRHHHTPRSVTMKVGLSYVSTADAAANLQAEDPGWSLALGRSSRPRRAWNAMLDRIDVQGAAPPNDRSSTPPCTTRLLDPSVFSDDNGQYEGADDQVHDTHGRRAVHELLGVGHLPLGDPAPVDDRPGRVSDMMQSLWSTTRRRAAGCPKWELAGLRLGDHGRRLRRPDHSPTPTPSACGDSTPRPRWRPCSRGPSAPAPGPTTSRSGRTWPEYEALGYVPQGDVDQSPRSRPSGAPRPSSTPSTTSPSPRWRRPTATGPTTGSMMARAQNWQNLFNPATGYIQARWPTGTFPPGPGLHHHPPPSP